METSCYGSLLVPLVNEKLPNELRVNIAKSFANDIWDIDIMINFLKKEVEAKERSFAVGMSFDLDDDIKNSSDVFSSSALYSQNKYSSRKPKVQHCVFCDKNNHSSNRCFKITDMEARKDLISRGQKNRISRGFNFANLVFSKTSRGFNFANSGFLKISRGFNFANSVLKQIFTKHLNIVNILKERRKMIYCHQYQESCFFFRVTGQNLFTNHLRH